MKLTICFLLFCVLYAGATTKSMDIVDGALQTPEADGIMGFGLELLLTKLEHIDQKLLELQIQIKDIQQKMANGQCDYQKTTTTPRLKLPPFASCKDEPSKVSGVYLIRVNNNSAPFSVFCEQEKFEGGWIVMQHRFNGSVDFYRNWADYRDGFGQLNSEFWLGLERIHQLTTARKHEIIIEMKDLNGIYKYAHYNAFEIGSESEQYRLKDLGSYDGTAGDSMTQYNKGAKFSTRDRDNDGRSTFHFAEHYKGAWWYRSGGGSSNLNGLYKNSSFTSIRWYTLKNGYQELSFTRMLIRELD
ncbi:angiopoietin-related protein 1-like [Anopheles aquasalis]|uniref:angiopoietin-related protein 1-like n=1 Tax=Anopheles aquasalis TaxID=42839 RepID=UPI00215B72C2|nr:angiopoietin-related protein 1-like [Anopheles aquasalis]